MAPTTSLDLEPEVLAARITDVHADDQEWLDRFQSALRRRRSGTELHRILVVWQLTKAEAGRLFGVSRQAVQKWAHGGVPADRRTEVGDLAAVTDVLLHYLRPERIPVVVRRPFDDAGGRTLLEVAAEDPAVALAHVRAMFDLTRVQA